MTTPPAWSELTRTTTQLLDALGAGGDELAWTAIDRRYRPVVARLASRYGLSAADAEDVAQQTLAEFMRAYRSGRYDRTSGRLGAWLLGIARNTLRAALRDHARHRGVSGDRPERVEDDSDLERAWRDERERAIVHDALAALRDDSAFDERTLEAFELVGLRGVPAADVAERCGMSVNQVYVARSRVTARLRELVAALTQAYDDDR